MPTTYRNNARGGHCPGHVRDTFLAALEAYCSWPAGEPEPRVDYEVRYEGRSISISNAAKLVWNCSDVLPAGARSTIEATDLNGRVKRWTYASAARALVQAVSDQSPNR